MKYCDSRALFLGLAFLFALACSDPALERRAPNQLTSGNAAAVGGNSTGVSGGIPGASGGRGSIPSGGQPASSSGGKAASGGAPAAGGNSATAVGGSTSGTFGSGGALSSGGGPNSGGSSATAAGGAPPVTTDFRPCPIGEPCKIMPLGDSITLGVVTGQPRATWGGYRAPLWHLARAANLTLTFVGGMSDGPQQVDGATWPRLHEGHSGYTIQGTMGLDGVVSQAISTAPPQIILLHIGTNDMEGGQAVAAAAPAKLGALLDQIIGLAPNALIVLAQIIPTQNDGMAGPDENAWVRDYNASMGALVQARAAAGKHIILVDMYSAFMANTQYKNLYLSDELHPTDAGYSVMAQVWFDAISGILH